MALTAGGGWVGPCCAEAGKVMASPIRPAERMAIGFISFLLVGSVAG
jgi:hypothetical protein